MEKVSTEIENMMTIPRPLLSLVYLIVPFLVVVTLVDMFFFNASLRPYLGIEAILFPLFVFIFNLPHIIASFFGFFDSEYVSHYRKHLFIYLPILLLATAALLYYDYRLGLIFFLCYDVWHGIKQKVGIGLILGAKKGFVHQSWLWVGFITSSLAYVHSVMPSLFTPGVTSIASPILFVGAILIILITGILLWQSRPESRWYIIGVSSLLLSSYFFILAGYVFFAMLMFRFVHDVSAFAFYITHDHNRRKAGHRNWLYEALRSIPLPILILTPVLAYLFAYLVRTATDGIAIGYSIVVLIGICHFYLEGFMWKFTSLHRKYVKVK